MSINNSTTTSSCDRRDFPNLDAYRPTGWTEENRLTRCIERLCEQNTNLSAPQLADRLSVIERERPSLCHLYMESSLREIFHAYELRTFLAACQAKFSPDDSKWMRSLDGVKYIRSPFSTPEEIHHLYLLKDQIRFLVSDKLQELYQVVFELLHSNRYAHSSFTPLSDATRAELEEIAKFLPFRKIVLKLLSSTEFRAFGNFTAYAATSLRGLPSIDPFVAAGLPHYPHTRIPESTADNWGDLSRGLSKHTRELHYLKNLFSNVFAHGSQACFFYTARGYPIHELMNRICLFLEMHGLDSLDGRFETALKKYVQFFSEITVPNQPQDLEATLERVKRLISTFPSRDLPYLTGLFSELFEEVHQYTSTHNTKESLYTRSYVEHSPVHEAASKICDLLETSDADTCNFVCRELRPTLKKYISYFERELPSFNREADNRHQFIKTTWNRAKQLSLRIPRDPLKEPKLKKTLPLETIQQATPKELHNLLFRATEEGDLKTIQAIATEHPHLLPNLCNFGQHPIHVATERGLVEVIKLFLQLNPNSAFSFSIGQNKKNFPINVAVSHGHLKVVELFLQHDPRLAYAPDTDDKMPIIVACEREDHEMIKLLAEAHSFLARENELEFSKRFFSKEVSSRGHGRTVETFRGTPYPEVRTWSFRRDVSVTGTASSSRE